MHYKPKHILEASAAPILNYSGSPISCINKIKVLKKHHYYVWQPFASGDAPKSIIKIYKYGVCRKVNHQKWQAYIAKVGHKWYPVESITEQLLTRIGQVLNFRMADSQLYIIKGQVRFCSKYFLKDEQELVHGADIISRYLDEKNIVDDIDDRGWSQELLTYQFVEEAVMDLFYDQWHEIRANLADLMAFDALTGNNDRHFYNWGIVRHLKNLHAPYFSPIYDSARGLFWNTTEKVVVNLHNQKQQREQYIVKYSRNTQPKLGWDGLAEINHIQLMEKMLNKDIYPIQKAQNLFSDNSLNSIYNLLDLEFAKLFSLERIDLIKYYLEYRFKEFQQLIGI